MFGSFSYPFSPLNSLMLCASCAALCRQIRTLVFPCWYYVVAGAPKRQRMLSRCKSALSDFFPLPALTMVAGDYLVNNNGTVVKCKIIYVCACAFLLSRVRAKMVLLLPLISSKFGVCRCLNAPNTQCQRLGSTQKLR